jgi:uncharacterized protein (TIGR00730 family)
VFCGASSGSKAIYENAAYAFGKLLAEKNIRVIYGGAKIGLMGQLAAGALDHGGAVIGVIPTFLKTKEVAHDELTELIEVASMHERKLKMHALCDAIVALPGGVGTFEELFESITWAQLGLHKKPIGLLNVHGFFTPLNALLHTLQEEGFIGTLDRQLVLLAEKQEQLVTHLQLYEPPVVRQWIRETES